MFQRASKDGPILQHTKRLDLTFSRFHGPLFPNNGTRKVAEGQHELFGAKRGVRKKNTRTRTRNRNCTPTRTPARPHTRTPAPAPRPDARPHARLHARRHARTSARTHACQTGMHAGTQARAARALRAARARAGAGARTPAHPHTRTTNQHQHTHTHLDAHQKKTQVHQSCNAPPSSPPLLVVTLSMFTHIPLTQESFALNSVTQLLQTSPFTFPLFQSHFHLSFATSWKKLTCGVIRSSI